MNRNVKIAKQLLKIAKMLVAFDDTDCTYAGLKSKIRGYVLDYIEKNLPKEDDISVRGEQTKRLALAFDKDELAIKVSDPNPEAEPHVTRACYNAIRADVMVDFDREMEAAFNAIADDDSFLEYAQNVIAYATVSTDDPYELIEKAEMRLKNADLSEDSVEVSLLVD